MSRTAKQLIDNLITAQEDYDQKNIGRARVDVCMKAFRERQNAKGTLMNYIIELETKVEDLECRVPQPE